MGADTPEKSTKLQEYLKAKHSAMLLKKSGLNYTIVRPGNLNNNEETNKITKKLK